MSQKISGLCFKVYAKEFPAKKGKPATTWYSIKMDDDKTWYRCKANNPGPIDGKHVEFEIGEIDGDSASVTSDVKIIEQKAPANGGTPAGSSGTTSTRDQNIQYQSARNAGIEYLAVIVAAGAVKLPVKESGRLEALDALLDMYTAQFFADMETFGAVARANGTDTESEDDRKDVSSDEE